MIVYAPNATFLPGRYPIAEKLRLIAEAGFSTFEVQYPRREGLAELIAAKQRYGLRVALINIEPDQANPIGYITNPAAEEIFWERLAGTFDLCHRLECQRIHALVGRAIPGLSPEKQMEIVVERLRRAVPLAAEAGVVMNVEALNTFDVPGAFLHNSREGFAIVRAVDSPWVRFQYDCYHMQIMEGNLINTIRSNIDLIGHFQIADVPGRHQPGTGEINYANVLKAIADTGYNGYVGLEYKPEEDGRDPFAWLPRAERERSF